MTTEGEFRYVDTEGLTEKAWGKVDSDGNTGFSYKRKWVKMNVNNIRGKETEYGVDVSGFAVFKEGANEKEFKDEKAIREGYYKEVESLLFKKLPGVKKVFIFDHTIRKHDDNAARQPVQLVHVDQTPKAAEARVRRHLADEAEELVKGRFQIVNVWRPIAHPASDFPLAVIDYRSTAPADMIPIDLLYPVRKPDEDDDDRGKERRPDPGTENSKEGYEAKGETYGIAYNPNHKFHYMKDMTPEEVMFIKCFDSRSEVLANGVKGIAAYTPHTAFIDPNTPKDAPKRQSIEVRCLVFYE